jgi:hypothetical protein
MIKVLLRELGKTPNQEPLYPHHRPGEVAMARDDRRLDVYLQEHSQLKQEQSQRIGFRDNLIYATLGAYAAILGFALGKDSANPYALLILPWVSLILGWTYLVNDHKISEIGRYIRYQLIDKMADALADGPTPPPPILEWETAHRSDLRRERRKLEQLLIDQVAFVGSGLVALGSFLVWDVSQPLHGSLASAVQLLVGVEAVLLLGLGVEIFLYADLTKGR